MEPNYNKPRSVNNDERTPGRNRTSNISGYNDNATAAAAATPAPTAQETSQTPDGVTMITPSASRRNQWRTSAQKEEDDWRRYREANRVTSVYEPPERTGGHASMEEARQRQFVESRQAKVQKKLKKEDQDRRKREEEAAEDEKKKAIARKDAERLEERRRQEEERRRNELREDRLRTTDNFLQKFERKGPAAPVASSSATRASSWLRAQDERERQRVEENSTLQLKKDEQRKKSDALEQKQNKNYEERSRNVQLDHRRVNAAFLDKLEGQGGESGTSRMEEEWREVGCSSSSFEDVQQRAHSIELEDEFRAMGLGCSPSVQRAHSPELEDEFRAMGLGCSPSVQRAHSPELEDEFRAMGLGCSPSVQRAHSPELQDDPPTPPDAYPRQCSSDRAAEADSSEPDDFEWALMRLESSLPYCDRGFLEDILKQSNGDYQQAYTLIFEMMA